MYLTILLDAEDIVDPRSDEPCGFIADMFAEEGAPASFGFTGEKVRLLEQRGRTDVLDAMRRVDLNYHSNYSSVHPTIAEYLEDKGWDEGIAEVIAREKSGIDDIERIFGRLPSCWVTPGVTWGPQVTVAVRRMGLGGEVYGHTHLEDPAQGTHYFCGTLCYANNYYGAFDAAFSHDEQFERRWEAAHEEIIRQMRAGANWLSIYMCNPTTTRAKIHWDKLNFDRGVNTPPEQYRLAEWTTDAEWEVAKRNMRRFVRELMRIPGVTGKTQAELNGMVVGPPPSVATTELQVRARLAVRQTGIATDDPLLSPAELLYLWALWVDSGQTDGTVPYRYVEGPVEEATSTPNVVTLPLEAVRQAAATVRQAVDATGRLPGSVRAGSANVGIGTAYTALARLCAGEATDPMQFALPPQVPAIGNRLASEIKHKIPGWLHKPDLDVTRHAAYTRLQSWTLKPALFR